MAEFANLSEVINRLTGGNSGNPEFINAYIDNRIGSAAAAALVTGRPHSLWEYNKVPGGQGAIPSTAVVPTNTTAGGLFQTNASGGREKWLLGMTVVSNVAHSYMVVDRLSHQGGLSGTVTTAQTTNLPTAALTRYSGTASAGNMIALQIYTLVGTTPTTVTASYTNQAGTAGQTTKAVTFGATGAREAQRLIILPLADGDTGVRSVESVTLAASTGTAGNFGVVIFRPLTPYLTPAAAGHGTSRDFISGLPSTVKIQDNACLDVFCLTSTTSTPIVALQLSTAER